MNFKIETAKNFRKQAEKLIKKYSSLNDELEELGEKLSKNPKEKENVVERE